MDFKKDVNYYKILGVTQDASLSNIIKAKDRLKFGNEDDRAPFSMWKQIDEAYEVLSNFDKRKEYDEFLKQNNEFVSSARTSSEFEAELERRNTSENTISNNNVTESLNTEEILNQNVNTTVEEENVQEERTFENVSENDVSNQNVEETISEMPQENVEEEKTEEELPIENTENVQEESPEENIDNSELNNSNGNVQEEENTNENVQEVNSDVNQNSNSQSQSLENSAQQRIVIERAHDFTEINSKLKNKITNCGMLKLQKNNNMITVKPQTLDELKAFEEYQQKFNNEVNTLLTVPLNNYRLEINKKKYETQIELLKKILEIRSNRNVKGKFDLFLHKAQVMSIVNQINSANKNLERVNQKIEEYEQNNKPKLAMLNEELMETAKQLNQQKEEPIKNIKFKNLEVKYSKLLYKRDLKGTRIKSRVIREGKFYDSIVKAKDFVKSRAYYFVSSDEIDEEVKRAIR